ncbi:MAG TPA: class E sortase [Streptosporangiaceae bacterium]
MSVRFCRRILGEILITLGVVILGFLAYISWGSAVREGDAQHGFAGELGQEWSQGSQSLRALTNPADVGLGRPFALIRIPKFGATWQFAVVQGSGSAQLALGPGHVPGTALPGMVGNFAVAGHRVTGGNPFGSLPSLRAGDIVYVETIVGTYEYAVTGTPMWVAPANTAVLAPVPGHPGQVPHRRMLTLITCDPPWTGTSRVIVTGVLVSAMPRQQGIEG